MTKTAPSTDATEAGIAFCACTRVTARHMTKIMNNEDSVFMIFIRGCADARVRLHALCSATLCPAGSKPPMVRKARNRASTISWTVQFIKMEHSRSQYRASTDMTNTNRSSGANRVTPSIAELTEDSGQASRTWAHSEKTNRMALWTTLRWHQERAHFLNTGFPLTACSILSR